MAYARRSFLTAVGASALAGGAASMGGAGQDDGQPSVSLLLNWKPNGLHVPYYAAKARGYYDDHGVTVSEIQSGQGSEFSAKQVGLGHAAFGVTSADQVLNVNSRGLDTRSVGVVMQRSPVVVFTTRGAFGGSLDRVEQLAGERVGTGPGMVRILTKLLLERRGVLDSVTLVDTGYTTVQQLLAGKIDAAGGVFADAIAARNQGASTSTIPVARFIPSYGHVLATDPAFAAANPAAVRGFLTATAQGAAWAHRHPRKAVGLLVDAVPVLEESRGIARQKWETMASEYVVSPAVRKRGWGWSRSRPWEVMASALADAGLLGGSVEPSSVWTNEYLNLDARPVGSYLDAAGASVPAANSTATSNATGGASVADDRR